MKKVQPEQEFSGTIVKESLEDARILDTLRTSKVRVTDEEKPEERWHLYTVKVTPEQLQRIAAVMKPRNWYAHFWNGNNVRVVFRDKIFAQKADDVGSWQPAIRYGLSVGIPREQLDFIIE
jgi:DNA-directed RNA polymerase beta subunit